VVSLSPRPCGTWIQAVPVNTILIMGHDKLSVELQRVFGGSDGITVLKVPKSGGVSTFMKR
jgi:polyribonucleotide 5'-hydroxyl-kinase